MAARKETKEAQEAPLEEGALLPKVRRTKLRFPPNHRTECNCSRCEFVRKEHRAEKYAAKRAAAKR